MFDVIDVREMPEDDRPPYDDGETVFPYAVYASDQLISQWESEEDAHEFAKDLTAYCRWNMTHTDAIYPANQVMVYLGDEATVEDYAEAAVFFKKLAEGAQVVEALTGDEPS